MNNDGVSAGASAGQSDFERRQEAEILEEFNATMRSRATTQNELKADLVRLVAARYRETNPAAVSLNELNRRFGGLARKLGTSCREMVRDLARPGGPLCMEQYMGSYCVFHREKHEKNMSQYGPKHFEVAEALRKAMIENAWAHKPKGKGG